MGARVDVVAGAALLDRGYPRSEREGGTMRFSQSNSFYGEPVDPFPHSALILARVKWTDVAYGQPAVFMETVHGQLCWVEVTQQDYLLVTPRDKAEEYDSEDEEKEATNTYQLLDNCYYVTAAALSGTTVDDLIGRTQEMQVRGGADLNAVSMLFGTAGLPSSYSTLTSVEDVESAVEKAAGGLRAAFGVVFTRSDGSAHMVLVEYQPDSQLCTYHDYQLDQSGADAASDIAAGTAFFLFGA
jgi:hypothetical protein